jgi:hypothetical protein
MPSALWLLIWLNTKAVLCKTGRQLKTVRGIIFFLVGITLLSVWIGPSIFFNRVAPPADPSSAMDTAPTAIFVLCLLNLFVSAGERAVTFSPAEVDFLFPGPFSRRQLLVYKLVKTGLASLFSAVIFSFAVGRLGGHFACRFVGVWLLFQFIQLLAMTLAMAQSIVGEQAMGKTRRWILIGLGVAAALAILEIIRNHHGFNLEFLSEARDTVAGRIVLAPFKVFASVLLAPQLFPNGLEWAAVAAAIDLAMAILVVSLDANYLEMSATVSAKRYDRLSRFRRGGVGGLAKPSSARFKLPMLPWLGGAGPIIWRQLSTTVRTARTLLIVIGLAAVGAGVFLGHPDGDQRQAIILLVGLIVWMNLFLSQMLRFDFRGDLDHMDVLRSLPIRPFAVAAAQLVAPTVVLSSVQAILLGTVAIRGDLPAAYFLAAGAFLIPLNLLAVGADNLMFLLFPFRPTTAVAGDMGLVGRQTIVFACRFLLVVTVAGVAAFVGASVWFLADRSWTAGAVAAWFPLAAAQVLIVWLIGLVYGKFDPSVNTPA